MLTLRSISYATPNSSAIYRHTRPKVAAIVGGTVGGAVGLIIIAAIIFVFCRRQHHADSDTNITENPDNEKESTTLESSKSQVAISKVDDPDRKLDDSTLLTTRKGSAFGGVIPQMIPHLSPESRFCASPDQHVSEAPIPDDGCQLVFGSPPGGEVDVATDADASAHAMMEMSSDLDGRDVELLSTYAMESHPTASESILHSEIALVPTPTVQQLNDWTETSKVVFSIDIGTSHSVGFLLFTTMTTFFTVKQAISFAYLQTQKEPVVENVSSWPGQVNDPTMAQTTTAIYYDKNGEPRSYGAMTQKNEIKEHARREGWVLVHSFKRHINNLSDVVSTTDCIPLPTEGPTQLSLPDDVPIGAVYAHWIEYLFRHAESVFIAKYTNRSWDKLKQNIEVIFTVPNGWYTQEHGILARAAVAAKIIQEPAQAKFVPETEAAIHWSLISSGLNPDVSNLQSKIKPLFQI